MSGFNALDLSPEPARVVVAPVPAYQEDQWPAWQAARRHTVASVLTTVASAVVLSAGTAWH